MSHNPPSDPVKEWDANALDELYTDVPTSVYLQTHGWAASTLPPILHTNEDVWRHWMITWMREIAQDFDVTIMVCGSTGSGKSSLAIRIARSVDPDFPPNRVVYSIAELLEIVQHMTKGQAVVWDEAIQGALATAFTSEQAKALIEVLNIVRAKNLIFIMCIPSPWDILKAIRARHASYFIWCERQPRGVAKVHTAVSAIQYVPPNNLGFMKDREWNPLTWAKFPDDDPWWNTYRSMKAKRIDESIARNIKRVQLADQKGLGKKPSRRAEEREE